MPPARWRANLHGRERVGEPRWTPHTRSRGSRRLGRGLALQGTRLGRGLVIQEHGPLWVQPATSRRAARAVTS